MSPELQLIYSKSGTGEFNPEKSDIFSAGLTFLRLALELGENEIVGMNDRNKGMILIKNKLLEVKHT